MHDGRVDEALVIGPAQLGEDLECLDICALGGQSSPDLAWLAFEPFSRQPEEMVDDLGAAHFSPGGQQGERRHSGCAAELVRVVIEDQRLDRLEISVVHGSQHSGSVLRDNIAREIEGSLAG